MRMLIAAEPATIIIKGSRFLARLEAVSTQEEARSTLAAIKAEYSDATHVVHAFVLGPSGGTLGCSDDGEPAGTAGRPVLEVLQGSGLTNVLLTVTRWFGGTKLGTGGLVRAYAGAAHEVLATAQSREIVAMASLSFLVPYSFIESVRHYLKGCGFTILKEEFGGNGAQIAGEIPATESAALQKHLADLSRGQIRFN